MKQIIYISLFLLTIITVFNCKKEQAPASRIAKYYYTGTGGVYPGQPVYGVKGTLIVPNMGNGGAADQSAWWSISFNDGTWQQHGVFYNKRMRSNGMVLHWYSGSTEIFPQFTLLNSPGINIGDTIEFKQENIGGGVWRYSVNDLPVYDAQWDKTGYRFDFNTEINNDRLSAFPTTEVLKVFEWKDATGIWHEVNSAFVGNSQWPIEGDEQLHFGKNRLIISRNKTAIQAPGTTLWSNNILIRKK